MTAGLPCKLLSLYLFQTWYTDIRIISIKAPPRMLCTSVSAGCQSSQHPCSEGVSSPNSHGAMQDTPGECAGERRDLLMEYIGANLDKHFDLEEVSWPPQCTHGTEYRILPHIFGTCCTYSSTSS